MRTLLRDELLALLVLAVAAFVLPPPAAAQASGCDGAPCPSLDLRGATAMSAVTEVSP